MTFLGIDLGWAAGVSGGCVVQWDGHRLHMMELVHLGSFAEVLAWVDRWQSDDCVIAIDAPTVIPNATGMRDCDRHAHHHFGRYHAGAYPMNLGLPAATKLLAFSGALELRGYRHAAGMSARSSGRFQIEVFPHPAHIRLFGLDHIIRYKKGPVESRVQELMRLRELMLTHLPSLEPALLPDLPLVGGRGKALKSVEDRLDSVVCAYIAAHTWYWGPARTQVLGDVEKGFMVVPVVKL
ncbi:MAG: DUF429 domain-containing protein [Fimbriimonas sp.]